MQISSNMPNINNTAGSNEVKTNFTEKISKDEVDELKDQIAKRSNEVMLNSMTAQSEITSLSSQDQFKKDYESFQSFLKDIGYDGKPIAELSQDEASELVSKDGLFGVEKTSKRIAEFVINGAGGDEKLLRAGREGVLQGFDEAKKLLGDDLADISKETMTKAIEMIDKTMQDLGFSVIDQEA